MGLVKASARIEVQLASQHFAREVVWTSVVRTVRHLLPRTAYQRLEDCATDAILAGVMEAHMHNLRGLKDDPIFGNFNEDWQRRALREPEHVPRICMCSNADKTVPFHRVESMAEWYASERGVQVEMVSFEGTSHCMHYLEQDVYFGRLSAWLVKGATVGRGQTKKNTAGSTSASTSPLADFDGEELEAKGWLLQTQRPGDGRSFPVKGSKVQISYKGYLLDGTSFDGSSAMECLIGAGQVLKAWDEAVMEMSVGQEARLICHHTYAYGENGDPFGLPPIPPRATLVFDMKLNRVN